MKIILTGATGYVGEGTLLELLKVDAVEKVLSVSRKPTSIKHEKLEEYLVPDFMQLKEGDEHFKGYDAAFFILSFAQMLLPISAAAKGVLWTVLFGLAKTCQYGGLTILGVEGYNRVKNWIKRKKE